MFRKIVFAMIISAAALYAGCDVESAGNNIQVDQVEQEIAPAVDGIEVVPSGRIVSVSGCKTKNANKSANNKSATQLFSECIEYSFDDPDEDNIGTLSIKHVNGAFNCCPGVISGVVDISMLDLKVTLTESESASACDCLCLNDVEYEITGFYAIEFDIEIEGLYNNGENFLYTVDFASTPTGQYCINRDFYPWENECTPPSAPANVNVSDAVSQSDPNDAYEKSDHSDQTGINIYWSAVPGAEYYKVYRCDSGEDCQNGGYYHLVSADDNSLTATAFVDEYSSTFESDCCDTPPCDCDFSDYIMSSTGAWHTFPEEGVEWGKELDVYVNGNDINNPLKTAKRYYYRVKAFNSCGAGSILSKSETGNRLPTIHEFFYELISPENQVFVNRANCCLDNNNIATNAFPQFEGDIQGEASYLVPYAATGGGTITTNFDNYQNSELIINGQIDLLVYSTLDFSDYPGWQTGTLYYSGTYNAEMDYLVKYTAVAPNDNFVIHYGIYDVRYEGGEYTFFHEYGEIDGIPILFRNTNIYNVEGFIPLTSQECADMNIPYRPVYTQSGSNYVYDCM